MIGRYPGVLMRSTIAAFVAACLMSSMTAAAGAAAEPKIVDPIIVESFDGTPIVATLMLPVGASRRHRVPVVFQTHGWGGTREQSPGGFTQRLLDNGYAVLTWDSRGFGDSGGEANVDSPEFEVRDAQALIDFVAKRKEILTDAPGDPRMGWIGGSYAGGIQLNTAAVDSRPDAIIPEIAWADLVQDLYPNRVLKKTWDQLLYAAGAASAAGEGLDSPAGPQSGVYAQEIHRAEAIGTATGEFPEDIEKWFAAKSTIINTPKITAPTMIIQGNGRHPVSTRGCVRALRNPQAQACPREARDLLRRTHSRVLVSGRLQRLPRGRWLREATAVRGPDAGVARPLREGVELTDGGRDRVAGSGRLLLRRRALPASRHAHGRDEVDGDGHPGRARIDRRRRPRGR
jgi:hypothetical protein